jgi:hypothetical protein
MIEVIDIIIALFLIVLFALITMLNILVKDENDARYDVTDVIDYAEFLYTNIELVSKDIKHGVTVEINHNRNLVTFINNEYVNFTISKVKDDCFRVVCEGIVLQKGYKTKITKNEYNIIDDALYILGLHKGATNGKNL